MAIATSSHLSAASAGRSMISGLFVASCLLSIVSWYTTMAGMELYLSQWFALLASLGIQAALVLVAWLIGFTRSGRGLLIAAYVMTASVSIAFSYASLYTWFAAKERPALVQRQLYDTLNAGAQKAEEQISAAATEARRHVLALEEMTTAEKTHGFISRSQDADPYLAKVREAVAREASGAGGAYREGTGEGVRYSAFDRYTRLASESVRQLDAGLIRVRAFRAQSKPLEPTEKQLRAFHEAVDGAPWNEVSEALHQGKVDKPEAPAYADSVDKTVSGQEDLLLAFTELVRAPTPRHVFSFVLAAFIDVIVFLLAFASGPYFFGAPEQQWLRAGARIEGMDDPAFLAGLLRKVTAGPEGTARLDAASLSSGELQFCLMLTAKRQATAVNNPTGIAYIIEPSAFESLMETMANEGLNWKAARAGAG